MIEHLINAEHTCWAALEQQAETERRVAIMAPDDGGRYPDVILSSVLKPSGIHLVMHEYHMRNHVSEYCLHFYETCWRVQRPSVIVENDERNRTARDILKDVYKGLGNLIAEMEPETDDQA